MKKIYCFCLLLSIFLLVQTGYSQSYLMKSELLPDQGNRDSRFAVQATVMQNDTWCQVTWPDPVFYWEHAYDDGDAEDFFVWSAPGNMSANKFHPLAYPLIVTGGRIFVGDSTFPGPFLGTTFRVLVYDDDGEGGLPGTALDSMDVTVNNYEWVEFEGMTASITEGDFYLAMKQMAPAPNTAPVGVDMDNPTYFNSYIYLEGDQNWVLSPLQDFMIRAWIEGYNEPPRSIDYFQVARFSDFDPYGSPLLGNTTILLDSTNSSEYDDYAWDTLFAGLYAYGVKTHFTNGEWSDYDVSNAVIHIMYLYPPSCFYQADTGIVPFIICPPMDSTGAIPPGFVGYNVYRDGDFVGYIQYLIPPPPGFWFDDLQPGIYQYELTAVYDLTSYGYPGETGESMALITECTVRYGYPLPFLEQWNTGTFETNNWLTDGPNWTVHGNQGNPDPTAEFTWDPILTDYQSSLTSYPFQADSMTEGKIYLDFDIKLNSVVPTGNEFLLVQVWNWESQTWNTAKTFSNLEGSFDWASEYLDITDLAMHQIFKLRFSAQGENSINILSWFIDNINVYRTCKPPKNLDSDIYLGAIHLMWEPPNQSQIDEWIEWDDGENSGNAVGTGGAAEFDAAARWESGQLSDFEGASLTEIGFYPMEITATYHIRVWVGAGAETMVTDQTVEAPNIGEWNYVTLNEPVPIDINQELWVGYYVNTPTGYPAGVDDGPAIDGYGNMMNYGGWQTLLQVNPGLDCNWNIKAHIQTIGAKKSGSREFSIYAIYREDLGNGYFLRAYTEGEYFIDDSLPVPIPWAYCYKVTALYTSGSDTCESAFSNETCQVYEGLNDGTANFYINFYPNPTKDVLKIESSEELGLISIYNSFGELMLKKNVDERQIEIPVSDYPAGVYMIRVESDGRLTSKKVMVIH